MRGVGTDATKLFNTVCLKIRYGTYVKFIFPE